MPRTTPLPAKEKEICRRVREWRSGLNLPLALVAEMLDLKPSYLDSIENLRTPLFYSVAKKFVDASAVNIHWLYHGGGNPYQRTFAPSATVLQVNNRTLFSVVYFQFLRHQMNLMSSYVPGGVLGREVARQWIDMHASKWLSEIPDEKVEEFVANLVRAVDICASGYPIPSKADREERLRKMAQLRIPSTAASAMEKKSPLQTLSHAVSISPMQPWLPTSLKDLLEKVRNLVAVRGRKVALADYVGVSAPRISEWLSTTYEPSAENVLKLLCWINDPAQHQDQQNKKTPASATNTREGKQTYSRNHDKSKTGPRRKR
jgi:transcriptional regulator with XRE-family HTH domain